MRILFTIISVILFTAIQTHAIGFKGTVADAENHMPMGQVNIYLQQASMGTVTNEEGGFSIDIVDAEKDVVVISYLGYLDYKLPVNTIDANKSYEILLKPDHTHEKKVTVKNITPKDIVQKSLKYLDDNYYTEMNILNAEMKESVKKGDTYIQYFDNEVVLTLPRVKYEDLKISNDSIKSRSKQIGFYGGKTALQSINEFTDLKKILEAVDEVKWTSEEISNLIKVSGREVYEVIFKIEEVVEKRNRLQQIILYIDKKSSAVISIHAYMDKGYHDYDKEETRFTDVDSIITYQPDFNGATINYRMYNDKWILSNMFINNYGRVVVSKPTTNEYIKSYKESHNIVFNIFKPGHGSSDVPPPGKGDDPGIKIPKPAIGNYRIPETEKETGFLGER
jgi:hypothetical protein